MEMLEHRLVLSSFLVTNADDSGEGSLRWAIEQANETLGADTITFAESLIDQPILLGGAELAVTDDVSINGLGADKLTISGNHASRVFSIAAGITAEISGVTIADGNADDGGGICNEGTLIITNSTFTGNYADGDGGGIWNDGLLTLADTTFSTNESWNTGGAIRNTGTLFITNGTFSENQTTYGADGWGNGGAIANHYGGKLRIAGSTFSQNAAGTGAAIDNFGTLSWPSRPGELEISDSIFKDNEAHSTGGAIWNDGPANITDSRFELNEVQGWGGAILHYACTMTLSNCTVRENRSGYYSGAIDNSGFGKPGTETETVLKVFNSTFSGNSTGREGGAIENYYATLEIANSTISGNSSDRDGGGIWNQGALNITNSTIFGNRADADGNGSGTGGGLWNWSGYKVQVLNNTILAGNVVGMPGNDHPDDIYGTVSSSCSHNLIGDPETAGGLEDGKNGNIVGDGSGGPIDISTVLDPNLADNGGPTWTHALVPGGLAVNAGDNGKVVSEYDQRGEGFARIYAGTVDIGALEVQSWFAQIDIKPGSDTNPINLASNGVIPVAIFTTGDFDASLVDASTVVFAGASAVHWALEDVDGDGDLDMVLHFRIQDTDLAEIYAQLLAEDIGEDGVLDSNGQRATVSLTGRTANDECFEGFDGVDLFLAGKSLHGLLEYLAATGVIQTLRA